MKNTKKWMIYLGFVRKGCATCHIEFFNLAQDKLREKSPGSCQFHSINH